jgi:hypothetical protein
MDRLLILDPRGGGSTRLVDDTTGKTYDIETLEFYATLIQLGVNVQHGYGEQVKRMTDKDGK